MLRYQLTIHTVDNHLLLTKPVVITPETNDYINLAEPLIFGSTVLRIEPEIIHLEDLDLEDQPTEWVKQTLAALRSNGWS